MRKEGPFTSDGRKRRALWLFGPEQVGYRDAWEIQKRALVARVAGRTPDLLLLVEHPHVYTIGKRGGDDHLLVPEPYLRSLGAEVFRVDRGGDVTYHGPGQLVGYPILDLSEHKRDVHWYLRKLEDVIIDALRRFGITATREPGLTGVWVGNAKVAAIGVKISRWVTMHGFALNVNTDLRYFDYIVPCGISNRPVTSMEKLLGQPVSLEEVAEVLTEVFVTHFNCTPHRKGPLAGLKELLSASSGEILSERERVGRE